MMVDKKIRCLLKLAFFAAIFAAVSYFLYLGTEIYFFHMASVALPVIAALLVLAAMVLLVVESARSK